MGDLKGEPGSTETTYPPPTMPPNFNFGEGFWNLFAPALMTGAMPTFPGQIDPGLSPSVQAAMMNAQAYGESPIPYSVGQAAGSLGPMMAMSQDPFSQQHGMSSGVHGALNPFSNTSFNVGQPGQQAPNFFNLPQPQRMSPYPGSSSPWNMQQPGPPGGGGGGMGGPGPGMMQQMMQRMQQGQGGMGSRGMMGPGSMGGGMPGMGGGGGMMPPWMQQGPPQRMPHGMGAQPPMSSNPDWTPMGQRPPDRLPWEPHNGLPSGPANGPTGIQGGGPAPPPPAPGGPPRSQNMGWLDMLPPALADRIREMMEQRQSQIPGGDPPGPPGPMPPTPGPAPPSPPPDTTPVEPGPPVPAPGPGGTPPAGPSKKDKLRSGFIEWAKKNNIEYKGKSPEELKALRKRYKKESK